MSGVETGKNPSFAGKSYEEIGHIATRLGMMKPEEISRAIATLPARDWNQDSGATPSEHWQDYVRDFSIDTRLAAFAALVNQHVKPDMNEKERLAVQGALLDALGLSITDGDFDRFSGHDQPAACYYLYTRED